MLPCLFLQGKRQQSSSSNTYHMLGWWKYNVQAVTSQERQPGKDCKVQIQGRRGLVAIQKSFIPLNYKWERVCPSQRNGQVDGIWLLVPSVLWSFEPQGCISTVVVWPCIPCRLHPTERATSYRVSTVPSTVATKILQIVWHSGWNAYWVWVQWMEPPSGPRSHRFMNFTQWGDKVIWDSTLKRP